MEWTRVATWDPGSSSSAPLPQTLPHHRLTPVDLHNLQSSIGQVPVYFSQISASSNSPPQAALTAVSSGVRAIAIDIAIAMQTVKRHQNQSCTQCRKSKKACDGYLLNGTQRHPSNATASSSSSRQIRKCLRRLLTPSSRELTTTKLRIPRFSHAHTASRPRRIAASIRNGARGSPARGRHLPPPAIAPERSTHNPSGREPNISTPSQTCLV